MAVMQMFLSHSATEKDMAQVLIMALRGARANVWFDERNSSAKRLLDEIQLSSR
jgi:hypothetical protein